MELRSSLSWKNIDFASSAVRCVVGQHCAELDLMAVAIRCTIRQALATECWLTEKKHPERILAYAEIDLTVIAVLCVFGQPYAEIACLTVCWHVQKLT